MRITVLIINYYDITTIDKSNQLIIYIPAIANDNFLSKHYVPGSGYINGFVFVKDLEHFSLF